MYMRGNPPKPRNLFITNCVFSLTCLNFSHFQNTLHLMQYTYWDFFPSVWTCWFWCLLVLLLFVVSPLPHQQNLSLWGLFSSGEINKKIVQRETGWIGRVEHKVGVVTFLVKNWTLSTVWAGALINLPLWNGQTCWKSLTINPLKLNAASHNNASWYRWVPRTLT